jgi:hypothetical protein
MGYFAKIGLNSKVIGVHAVNNSDLLNADGVEDETVGVQFLENLHGWPLWKQTSYNTRGGKHYKEDGTESDDQSKAFRKNYAGIGHTYDEDRDAFIGPTPFASWILVEDTCQWQPPVAHPTVITYSSSQTWTQEEIDNSEAPDGTSAGDVKVLKYFEHWDDLNVRWAAVDQEDPKGSFIWDASELSWVAS